jgi:hypothetical protein
MTAWRRELELLGLLAGLAIFPALVWLGLNLDYQAALIVGESKYGSKEQAARNVGFGHAHLVAFQIPGILFHMLLGLAAWYRQPRLRVVGFSLVEFVLGLWAAFVWPMWSSLNAHLAFPVLTMLVYYATARRWPSLPPDPLAPSGRHSTRPAGEGPPSPAAGA